MDQLVQDQEKLSSSILSALTNFKKDSASRKTVSYANRKLEEITVSWNKFILNHRQIQNLSETSSYTPYLFSDCYKKTRSAFEDLKERLTLLEQSEVPHLNETNSVLLPFINSISSPTTSDTTDGINTSETRPNDQPSLPNSSIIETFEPVIMTSSRFLDLIPPFDPKGDIQVFVDKAQTIHDLLATTEDRTLFATMIYLKLSGPIVKNLSAVQRSTWEELKKVLLATRPRTQGWDSLQSKLSKMTQNSSETAKTFGERITSVYDDMILSYQSELTVEETTVPASTLRILERQATRVFEDGLRDPGLKALALGRETEPSLSGSISFISDREGRMGTRPIRSREPTRPLSSQGVVCHKCGVTGHYANVCNNARPASNANIKQELNTTDLFCRYCKATDHEISNCQERVKNNLRQHGTPNQPFVGTQYTKHTPSNGHGNNTVPNKPYQNPFSSPSRYTENIKSNNQNAKPGARINTITHGDQNEVRHESEINSHTTREYPFCEDLYDQEPPGNSAK